MANIAFNIAFVYGYDEGKGHEIVKYFIDNFEIDDEPEEEDIEDGSFEISFDPKWATPKAQLEELIQKLQSAHGLSREQSYGILNTITGYIKEKFPMVAGAVDNLFQLGTTPEAPGTSTADVQATAANPAGEKIEEFAKGKLGGFFGGNKTS